MAFSDEGETNYEKYKSAQLHWMISDKNSSIVIEPLKNGLKIYENPVGVLTNNPTFDYHLMNLNNYMSLNEGLGENKFSPELKFNNYGQNGEN